MASPNESGSTAPVLQRKTAASLSALEIKQTRVAKLFQRQAAHGEMILLFRRHLGKRPVTAQRLKDRVPTKAVTAARRLGNYPRNCSGKNAILKTVVVAKESDCCNCPIGFVTQQFADPIRSQSPQKPFD